MSPDPFAELELAAQRQAAGEKALKAVAGARSKLVLGTDARSVFFATLALQLEPKVDWDTGTMATDGRSLFVNPDWCNGLTADERVGVVAHEALHCALKHHCRRDGRDPSRWNEGADLAINQLLVGAGFTLPKTRLMPGEGKYAKFPREKSAEEYYALLGDPPKGSEAGEAGEGNPAEASSGRGSGGTNDPGGCGEVRDAKDEADAKDQEAQWDSAVSQAEQASKARGSLPAGLQRLVGEVLHPAADWKAILREFLSQNARNDFSWSRPNKRHIAAGLYLPGMRSQELGEVVVAVDTSGSIGRRELELFGSELEAILGSFDCSASILYHDSAVCRVDEWQSSDGPLKLNPVGGGGTSHVPVFDWVRDKDTPPACVIALTDLWTTFPAGVPDVPVLWAVTGGNQTPPPFGRVVEIG